MGLKASVLTLTHFLITFGLAIVLAVGFASNNWIEGSFIKGTHGVTYTSGLFLGCMNFLNKTGLCSNKIVYGAKGKNTSELHTATFNLNLGGNPEDFILKLVRLAYNNQEEFEIHEECI
ncbi:hypothetical protein HZS_8047 [Henneguya salminicola]|nr:hypothetical protein HZS_8047 [Henneguya salminicola]